MDTRKRRSQRDYTLTFKLSVVDQVEKSELSYERSSTGLRDSGSVDGVDVVT